MCEDEQFLNLNFQKKLWEKNWGDLVPFIEGETYVDFFNWFTSIDFSKEADLAYSSKTKKVEDYYINKSVLIKANQEIDIKIVLDTELTNRNEYDVEPAMLISALKEGYILNVDECESSIKSKKVSISKKDFFADTEILIEIRSPKKNTEFYLTSAGVVRQDDIESGTVKNLWQAVDAVKTSDTSLKLFLSYNHEYPDFTDLVLDVYFPGKLQYIDVGFPDDPTYFSRMNS